MTIDELKEKYTYETSNFVVIDGLDIHYCDEGEGEIILLVHGTFSSLHSFDDWNDLLVKQFRVIRMDLPGFGLTGPHPDHLYSIDDYSDFLNSFLEKLQIKSCSIAGNSLGGWLSWEFAIKYQNRVDKLVLIDSAGYIDDDNTCVASFEEIGDWNWLGSIDAYCYTQNVACVLDGTSNMKSCPHGFTVYGVFNDEYSCRRCEDDHTSFSCEGLPDTSNSSCSRAKLCIDNPSDALCAEMDSRILCQDMPQSCPVGFTRQEQDPQICVACAMGKFKDSTDTSPCILCPAGKFSNRVGGTLQDCVDCPHSLQGSSPDRTSCAFCKQDEYLQDRECHSCPENSASALLSTSPSQCYCEYGYEDLGFHNEPARCRAILCGHGQYVEDLKCDQNCPDGTFKTTFGSSKAECLSCQSGKFTFNPKLIYFFTISGVIDILFSIFLFSDTEPIFIIC